ncbi:hypothetical protein [Kineosporia sp. R_H_3]|uniref:hypothetical protein n=1 Tax=Kineosporia sp. R_H_3 TaxID=1961848 RepID=UPI000B4ACE16|nr:hypothetical protein [Kineosporia sp. R_H_3]
MTVKKVADVQAALTSKGMTADESSHHKMLRLEVAGTTKVVTRISHGMKEIDEHLGALMAKQCFLHLKEFWDLVDCPLSAEQWTAKIQERSVGGRNPFLGY